MYFYLKSRLHLNSLAKNALKQIRLNALVTAVTFIVISAISISTIANRLGRKCLNEIEYEAIREWEQTDPRLIDVVREKIVMPPPKHVPYNLMSPFKKEQSQGQVEVIKELFKDDVSTG